MISVIVPIYNTEKYLDRCIQSILSQTYTDFELLLVDDGSTDSSGAICDKYAKQDSRVRVFHKENGGVSSARNLGLDNVKGEWVTFCDSDDWVEDYWLNTFIENSKNTDLVVQGFNNGGLYKFPVSSFYVDVKEALFLLFENKIVGYTVVKFFKSKLLKKNNIKFNETIKFREDEDFVLKYLCFIRYVRFVNQGGYNYVMPDLSKKYNHIDNFSASLSMYNSVLRIFRGVENTITESYLLELINSYCFSFNNKHIDHLGRTKSLKKVVKKNIMGFNRLAKMSRIMLYYATPRVASLYFSLKNLLRR